MPFGNTVWDSIGTVYGWVSTVKVDLDIIGVGV